MRIDQYGAGVSVHFQRNATLLTHALHAATTRGYIVQEFDCDRFVSIEDLLTGVGRGLNFPDDDPAWTRNIAAFVDWLTDLVWLADPKGILVLLRQSESLWARWPYETGVFVESWLHAADLWHDRELPLHLIFQFS
jgi:hypothetical protein